MTRRFILDSNIIFYPETCEFRDYTHQEKSIQVNQPASRCLELLIEKAPQLVLQKDFYAYVWGDAATTVQLNTLYQNISLLRRTLKFFGNDYADMVLTVPRRGFKFNERYTIQPFDDEDGMQLAEVISGAEPDARYVPMPGGDATASQTTAPHNTYSVHFFRLILMISSGIAMLWLLIVSPDRTPSFGLESYAYKEKISNCAVYTLNKYIILTEAELRNAEVNCKKTPILYVKHDLFSTEKTLIACNEPFIKSDSPDCITYHLLEDQSHEE